MENNKTDKCQNEGGEKNQHKSDTEIKLELREYFDNHIRDIRDIENTLQQRFEQKIKDYKHELEDSIKQYKKIGAVVIGIITFFGAGGIYQGYQAYKQAISRGIEKGQNQISNQISSRLDQEFEAKNIKRLIENTAKDYTEKEAKNYISDEVRKVTTPFNELFNIYILSDKAQNGSRSAYIQLRSIAIQQTNNGIVAKSRLINIQKTLEIYKHTPLIYPNLIYKTADKDIPIEEFSLDQVVKMMEEDPAMSDSYRAACMVYIKNKPHKEVLQKAFEVLKMSESLPACAAFMGVLSDIIGLKAAPLDFEGWIKICEEELKK